MNKKPTKINLTSDDSLFEKSLNLQKYIEDLSSQAVNLTDKFSFSWAGKSNTIKSVLVPSKLTLNPEPKQSIKWDESENLFIEGDNLEVLKLLQKAYFEKVKMIYIDPPYNTGHDFVYNDDFSSPLGNYLKQTGQKSENGDSNTTNKETNGRYHSDWLSMMYPRLKLAWNLLREDGAIFVSIDDNEVHHLRMLMDEVFGEENFVASVIWKRKRGRDNSARWFSKSHEYLLIFAKDLQQFNTNYLDLDEETKEAYKNPDNDPRGDYRMLAVWARGTQGGVKYDFTNKAGQYFKERLWLFSKTNLQKLDDEDKLLVRGDNLYRKLFIDENKGKIPETIWDNTSNAANASDEIKSIFGGIIFDTPKPIPYIQEMLKIATSNDDIVLDFFAGSGTTGHAVLKQNQEDGGNRKFILVQLPEKLEVDSDAYKAGYKTIADVSRDRIKRAINGYGENPQPIDAGFKVFTLAESNYPENNFVLDVDKSQEENEKAFIDYLNKAKQSQLFDKENDTSLVYENIVKEGLSLNSRVEKVSIGKNNVYQVTDGEQQLLICLENKLASETVKELTDKSHKGKLFVCLESSLDDTTAANLSLNLDLKTI
jgi:adenine-specific DNA-methyltransferase